MNKSLKVIDLFSGCGGLSYGFSKAGYEVVLGVDNWKDALDTFAENHAGSKVFIGDLHTEAPEEILRSSNITPKEIDVIIGGPPCQGFSISGKRDVADPRNSLYKAFVRFVETVNPKAFLLENVPNLVSMDGGCVKESIVKDFEQLGYRVVYKILKASDFGVPQNRRRVVFIGLKDGKEFAYPESSHGELLNPYISVEDAISDLPKNGVPDGTRYNNGYSSEYQRLMQNDSTGIHNHESTEHNEQTVKIIALVPDGGNYKNLPDEYKNTRKVHIAWTRLNSKKPSLTIDTGHRHHFHYKYNRIPTVRESARIQSFPDSFIFKGSKTSQYKQVGNAVPPLMAEALAKELLKYL